MKNNTEDLDDWTNKEMKALKDKGISQRALDWLAFSMKVLEHIEEYTTKQYGDKGEDICTNYTVEECLKQAKKYNERYGKNIREGQQELDFLKSAHFIQMAYEKYMNGTKETSKHDERIDEICDIHKTTENSTMVGDKNIITASIENTPIRIEYNTPTAYRLYRDHHGELHLQGYFYWSEGTNGGFEWRTIETVTNPD